MGMIAGMFAAAAGTLKAYRKMQANNPARLVELEKSMRQAARLVGTIAKIVEMVFDALNLVSNRPTFGGGWKGQRPSFIQVDAL